MLITRKKQKKNLSINIQILKLFLMALEISFDSVMHRQKDGISMGNLLSTSVTDIFTGFYGHLLYTLCRFHLCVLNSGLRMGLLLELINGAISFLDVCVQNQNSEFLNPVYRRRAFTGFYTR